MAVLAAERSRVFEEPSAMRALPEVLCGERGEAAAERSQTFLARFVHGPDPGRVSRGALVKLTADLGDREIADLAIPLAVRAARLQ